MRHEQVLEALHAKQQIDAVGPRVAYARAVVLAAHHGLQAGLVVQHLVGEADVLPALHLVLDRFFAALAETQKQRVLFQETAFDLELVNVLDQPLDAPDRHLPDVARGLDAVTAHQLVELQLAVGRKEARAAARRAAADNVLVDHHHAKALAQEFGGGADPTHAAADHQHVARNVLGEWRTIVELLHQQGGEPPILIDHRKPLARDGVHGLH